VTTLPLIVPIAAISWELLSAEHVESRKIIAKKFLKPEGIGGT